MEYRCSNCEILFTALSQSHRLYINDSFFKGETVWCKECNIKYKQPSKKKDRIISMARAEQIRKLKLARGCEWEGGCEWTEGKQVNSLMLEMDHIDPSIKFKSISTMVHNNKYSWNEIMSEMAKCRVLCKMHHAIIPSSTHKRRHLVAI
jgi:hypothetical protein